VPDVRSKDTGAVGEIAASASGWCDSESGLRAYIAHSSHCNKFKMFSACGVAWPTKCHKQRRVSGSSGERTLVSQQPRVASRKYQFVAGVN